MTVKLNDYIGNSSKLVGSISAEDDWHGFQHHKGGSQSHNYVDILPQVSTKDQNAVLVTKSVVKEGHLEMKGRPYYAVITDQGFLHYFTSPQQLNPEASIPLQRVGKLTKFNNRHFSFEYTPAGWFVTPQPFEFGVLLFGDDDKIEGKDSAEADAWINEIRKFTKEQQ